MAKYFYNFNDQPLGAFANGGGMSVVMAGPSDKSRSIIGKYSGLGYPHVFRITQGGTTGQDLTAFDVLKNHGGDTESLVLFTANAVRQVPGSYGVMFWDYTAAGQGLGLVFLPARNVKSLVLYDDKAGRTAQFVNYDWQNGTRYWLRWRVEGGANHYIKIWQDGTSEPTGWTMTTTYVNRTSGDHYIGLGTYAADNTIDYLQASFATNGDRAPISMAEYMEPNNASTPAVGGGGGFGGIGGYGVAYGEVNRRTAKEVTLSPNDTVHSHLADSITISQTHNLSPADTTHSHTVDSIAIKQEHRLNVQDTTHTLTSDEATVLVTKSLEVDDVTHSITSEEPKLIVGLSLSVSDTSHVISSDNIQLKQNHKLVPYDTFHSHVADNATIVDAHGIVVHNTTHTISDSGVRIIQNHKLAVDSTTHSHEVEHLNITQKWDKVELKVANTTHSISSDNIEKIFNWTELGFNYGAYKQDWAFNGGLEDVQVDGGNYVPQMIENGKF